MATAYLSLGTNLGDLRQNLAYALFHLAREPRIILEQVSGFFETKPYGVPDQPDFLNACCRVYTDFSPFELLAKLKAIEQEMGREPSRHWGERLIDLDIIFYDDQIVNTPDLEIPHHDMENRAFVLAPLMEIAPDFVHPVLKKTVSELFTGG